MIAALLTLALSAAPLAAVQGATPLITEVRWRHRKRRRTIAVPTAIPEPLPTKTHTIRIIQDHAGRWIVAPRRLGIEDIYDAVPPFNRSPAP